MPQQPRPDREYSAERQGRMRHFGSKVVNGKSEVTLPDLMALIYEMRQDIAELRETAAQGLAPAVSDGARESLEVRIEIAQMVRIITQAKQEIASIKHPLSEDDRMLAAAGELDAIVLATETSTEKILAASEAIEGLVRTISGRYPDDEDMLAMSDQIANAIINIFEACNFQDITGQRINKVVKIIKFIEQKILAMIEIWGIEAFAELPVDKKDEEPGDKALMNGPQLTGLGISQADINALFE